TEVNLDMVARDTGLGLHVLHRLQELTRKRGTSLVTSARLAEHLHVSTRTANRILGRLLDNGYAGLEGKDLTRDKGRPARVIRLRL
ncbi:MAG TPA: HTH domain-containing protein, partial [Deinococcales bacterium]|nr:HTH domain-containing protein [Deinococcales bacterium]